MQLEGAKVLVTGAAGGLGRALAAAFTARGASLVLTARRLDQLGPTAEGSHAIAADLADPAAVEALPRYLVEGPTQRAPPLSCDNFFLRSSLTSIGLALPSVARMIWPTKKP